MNVLCPHCRQPVPAEKVNVATDLAMCPACADVFKVSESVDLDSIDDRTLENSPPGTWYAEEVGGFSVGATTRSLIALFLIPFACVWSVTIHRPAG
ncbi:MAG: hypothetical protein WD066_19670 [Planctomycetaceae bacterium]